MDTTQTRPTFTHEIPFNMIPDTFVLREALKTLYGDDWVSCKSKGHTLVVKVAREDPVDLKGKLLEDDVLIEQKTLVEIKS